MNNTRHFINPVGISHQRPSVTLSSFRRLVRGYQININDAHEALVNGNTPSTEARKIIESIGYPEAVVGSHFEAGVEIMTCPACDMDEVCEVQSTPDGHRQFVCENCGHSWTTS